MLKLCNIPREIRSPSCFCGLDMSPSSITQLLKEVLSPPPTEVLLEGEIEEEILDEAVTPESIFLIWEIINAYQHIIES